MEPSPVVGPPSVGRPLRLLPFRGWRLTPGRVGDPATARLFARPYRDVAERLDRWRADGQLLDEREPAVYVHEYTAAGLTVRGLVGALDISHRAASARRARGRPARGHPSRPGDDLADRMTTWELNPAPILLVHRGPRAVRDLVDRTLEAPPLHEYRRPGRPTTSPVGDPRPRRHPRPQRRPGRLACLDRGRSSSLRRLSPDATASPRDGPADRGLAMLVDQADTPLFLGAIHRVFLGASLEELGGPTSAAFAPARGVGCLRSPRPGHAGGHGRAQRGRPSSSPARRSSRRRSAPRRAAAVARPQRPTHRLPPLGRRGHAPGPQRGVAVLMPAPDSIWSCGGPGRPAAAREGHVFPAQAEHRSAHPLAARRLTPARRSIRRPTSTSTRDARPATGREEPPAKRPPPPPRRRRRPVATDLGPAHPTRRTRARPRSAAPPTFGPRDDQSERPDGVPAREHPLLGSRDNRPTSRTSLTADDAPAMLTPCLSSSITSGTNAPGSTDNDRREQQRCGTAVRGVGCGRIGWAVKGARTARK